MVLQDGFQATVSPAFIKLDSLRQQFFIEAKTGFLSRSLPLSFCASFFYFSIFHFILRVIIPLFCPSSFLISPHVLRTCVAAAPESP
jgi:hypothetical protein